MGDIAACIAATSVPRGKAVKREHVSSSRRCISFCCVFSYMHMLVKSTLENPRETSERRVAGACTRQAQACGSSGQTGVF